jgi:hypothetical protein
MLVRSFQQGLVHLLAVTMLAIFVAHTADATIKSDSTSRLLCDRSKVKCEKKPSKAKASTQRANTKRRPAKPVEAKPSGKPKEHPSAKPAQTTRASPGRVPKPTPKPFQLNSDTTQKASVMTSPPLGPVVQQPTNSVITPGPPFESKSCRAELLKLGVDFSVPDNLEGTGECNVVNPVQLKSIRTSTGRVDLPGLPILNCAFARKFGAWISDIAAPVVVTLAQAQLSSFATGSSYECRGRRGDSTSKLSEHAFGNAIDIGGITLGNNKRIEISDVADNQDPDYRLLLALRISACGYFTTVLGPGANAAHASHYHFDLGAHGKSGTYRICE